MTSGAGIGGTRPRPPRRVVPPDRAPDHPALDAWLHMASSGWYLNLDDVLADPRRMALISADACWYFSYEDWRRRRPLRRRRTAWRAWRAEEAVLAAQQHRLVRAAFALHTLRPSSSA
jgi:hypothetical protein